LGIGIGVSKIVIANQKKSGKKYCPLGWLGLNGNVYKNSTHMKKCSKSQMRVPAIPTSSRLYEQTVTELM
jgi:hypothetical protein